MRTVLASPFDRDLVPALEESGARVSIWPPLKISAPVDDSSMREAIENLFGYDWLILKNLRAAEYFLRAFFLKHDAEQLDEMRVLTVGSAAAEKFTASQLHVDIALEELLHGSIYREIESYTGESSLLSRQNLLVPSANITTESFENWFMNAGARVDAVTAYQTCADKSELIRLTTLLAGGGIDFVVFTGAAAIGEFARLLDTDDLARVLTDVKVACLDQATRDLASRCGLSETLIPSQPTISSLVTMIEASVH